MSVDRSRARHRPTIHDVAAAAGVSRGTVSRALNGGHNVSPGALEAVLKAVRTTGYVANSAARNLVTQRAHSVAFVLAEPQSRLFEDPNFSILLQGCTQELAELDVPVLLMTAGTEVERKRTSRFIAAGHVDGVLLVSSHKGNPLIHDLYEAGIPVVACGKPLGHEGRVAYAAADDRAGARMMVEHLLARGRRRIATITGPVDTPGGVERLAGYRDVLGDEATPDLIAHGDYSRASGEAAMAELLRRAPDLDAVFVASDLMAAGALNALHDAGRRVPEDVAVGGFDDSSIATSTRPALTTVRHPFQRITREMVRLLLEQIQGEPPAAAILPTELVVRAST
ncbi:LacI family transcriptional regulator [Saccharothrix sp. ALI-22-I]|uniref:LacI family DNA-binding transcriptional regulator n=1 Tax=Saccharothrix sp. ALI-22-I TaxID=1933778 RepID=UPI00097C5790|nr:LacI family DNA-binding transcriptional regulator [Saccharothrix sp. ALI-22-I]ONI85447.1 LacI family transcriptional regulator [Saccharothrix sp. ALI-22-I]